MSKDNLKISKDEDNCSKGTCVPVNPFSYEGLYFFLVMFGLIALLLLVLYVSRFFI